MPFHEDEMGTPIVEFGSGDIFMFNAHAKGNHDWQFIVFQDARVPGQIGERQGKSVPDGTNECDTCMETKIKFAFNKTESIDQLIIQLLHSRAFLEGKEYTREQAENDILTITGTGQR